MNELCLRNRPSGRDPAEAAASRSPYRPLAIASAMMLRALLPVQRNRIDVFGVLMFDSIARPIGPLS